MIFRTLDESGRDAARHAARGKLSPFIVGEEYALTMTDKRRLLAAAPRQAQVLFPWVGQWSTDVFVLSVSEAEALVGA